MIELSRADTIRHIYNLSPCLATISLTLSCETRINEPFSICVELFTAIGSASKIDGSLPQHATPNNVRTYVRRETKDNTDTDTDTDADADAGTDADTYTGADADTGTGTGADAAARY